MLTSLRITARGTTLMGTTRSIPNLLTTTRPLTAASILAASTLRTRTTTTAAGITVTTRVRRRKKRTNTEKNRIKKERRKARKRAQPPVRLPTKTIKKEDPFDEDVFKCINPVSFINALDLRLKPDKYPRFIYKNQKKANTWSCQLRFIKKRWASKETKSKKSAKNEVCQKAVMEIYEDLPEICMELRNQILNLD